MNYFIHESLKASTVKKIETGSSIALDKFVRILRTLRKLDVLNAFIFNGQKWRVANACQRVWVTSSIYR